MTREEAIKVLERVEDYVGIHYINGVEDPYINPYLLKAIDFAVAALREQEERRWIPVTDRLPEIGRKCLIANREIVVRGWLRPDGVWKTGVSSDEIWRKFSLYPPTHWMPLPEPPKEE